MKNYQSYSKALNWILGAIALALVIACFCGCSPYNRLKNRPPRTAKDSLALLARCNQLIPLDTTSTHFTSPEAEIIDSSAYFKAIADSLSKRRVLVRDSIKEVYIDTCTSCVGLYEHGFNDGFDSAVIDTKDREQAKANEKYRKQDSACKATVAVMNKKIATNAQAASLQITEARIKQTQAEKDKEKYQNKYNRLLKWTFGLAVAFLLAVIVCIILWKFKRQARAANNIINDVKDLKT